MGFLIGEMIAFLAGAALIGLFIGWALFGGKKAPAPAATTSGVPPEALKRAEGRVKELEGERSTLNNSLVDRDDEIARLRHQMAQNEQHRVESAGRLEQLKAQVETLQAELRTAPRGDQGGPHVDPALVARVLELEALVSARDAELKQLRQQPVAPAATVDATADELRAQVAELRAILETGGPVGGGDESEQVSRLLDQVAKLSEENLGLKAAYEAAERSLEEQDGAMDQLSLVLLKSQQETATLKQDVAGLKAQLGRQTSDLGITFPPPLPPLTSPAVPGGAAVVAERDAASGAVEDAPVPRLPEVAPPRPFSVAELPVPTPPTRNTARVTPTPSAAPPAATAAPVAEVVEEVPLEAAPPMAPPGVPPAAEDAVDDEDTEMDLDADSGLLASIALDGGASGLVVPPPASPDARDDLKRIKGIGPATEKRLVKLGFVTWSQLASLDEGGVDALAQELKLSADKIRREGWLASARELAAGA